MASEGVNQSKVSQWQLRSDVLHRSRSSPFASESAFRPSNNALSVVLYTYRLIEKRGPPKKSKIRTVEHINNSSNPIFGWLKYL